MTALFSIAVGDPTLGAPEQEINSYEAWTLTNNLDEGCSLEVSLRGNSPAALLIDELATDLWLYREGTLIQRFRIVSVEQEWGPDGSDDVRLVGACYRRLLKKSHVRSVLTYSATSQGDIVWDLVQHAQAADGGNLGITLGSAGPSVPRDREYLVGTNIFDAITELSQIQGGIAWDIDENLQLIVTDQTSFPVQATPVQLGMTARRLLRPSSAEQFANAAIVLGNVEATTPVIVQTPGILTDPRGRYEKFVSVTQAVDQATLTETANGVIEESLSPLSTWQIEMEPTRYFYDAEYQIGDFVTLSVPRSTVYTIGTPGITVAVQVIAREITQTADGNLSVNVAAIEVPGS